MNRLCIRMVALPVWLGVLPRPRNSMKHGLPAVAVPRLLRGDQLKNVAWGHTPCKKLLLPRLPILAGPRRRSSGGHLNTKNFSGFVQETERLTTCYVWGCGPAGPHFGCRAGVRQLRLRSTTDSGSPLPFMS
jgi:hypothetical protein